MKKVNIVLVVVVTLLLLPSAFSLSCNSLNGVEKDTCNQINGLPITEEEKQVTLTASLEQDRSIPNHDFVESWNNQIEMNEHPDNVSTSNQGVIKDAWLKLADIMPSVLENDTLYVNNQGNVQSFYNYRIELPTGTASGDCSTSYSLASQDAQLQVSLNNVLIGNDKISNYQTSENGDLTFLSQLTITAQTKIDHSQNYHYCSKYYYDNDDNRKCKRYSDECRYSYTSYQNDVLTLTDNLLAKADPRMPKYDFTTLNDYGNSIKGQVNASNYTEFQLNFADSNYKITNYIYDYVYSLSPYNILTLKAIPYERKISNNINIQPINNESFNFVVNNKQNCQITLFTHFSNQTYQCFPEIILKGLKVATDKIHYFANETISVSVEPKGIPVKIDYANETYTIQDSITLKADPKYSRVIAYYDDEQAIQVVSVTDESHLVTASQIGLFILINYVIFAFLTKEVWVLKWLNVAS